MNTQEINLFVFDTPENFKQSKEYLGEEGSTIRRMIQVNSLSEFKSKLDELDGTDQVSLAVHVFYTENINGLKKFAASGILNEFGNLDVMYISDGDEIEIKHQMIDAKITNAPILKYHEVLSSLRDGKVKVRTKSDLIVSKSDSIEKNELQIDFDYGIITALYDDEFEEVKKHFQWCEDKCVYIGTKKYWVGHLIGQPQKRIVAAIPSATGMVDSAIIATQMLERFKPKYLLMSGVCGGPNVPLGDIILAKSIFTFQKGKVSDIKGSNGEHIDLYDKSQNKVNYDQLFDGDGNQIKISIEKFEVEHDTIIPFKLSDTIQPYIKNIRDQINKSEVLEVTKRNINIHLEPMACSTMVINKGGFFEDNIKSINRHTIAVEMESYGVARACEFANEGKTNWIIFKSVMDNTKDKTDDAKRFAAHTSALFLKHLLYENILK